ncbi:MAG: sulfotransferase [Cyclobacteriaceae bacterium]
MTNNFLFVCGCGRSGTTAMLELLNSHHRIALGTERYKFYAQPDTVSRMSKNLFEYDNFFNINSQQTNLNSTHPAWEQKLKSDYEMLKHKFEIENVIKGDKYPRYFRVLKEISEKFDNPKWIFMLRDVYDVALSWNVRANNIEDKGWSRKRDYSAAVVEWNEALTKTYEFNQQKSRKLFVCKYEKIFSNNKDYLNQLCKFLGIELDLDLKNHYHLATQNWQERLIKQQEKKYNMEESQKAYIEQNANFDVEEKLCSQYGI